MTTDKGVEMVPAAKRHVWLYYWDAIVGDSNNVRQESLTGPAAFRDLPLSSFVGDHALAKVRPTESNIAFL